MVKVKGLISRMAMCMEDSEQRTAELARLFFHELAAKGRRWSETVAVVWALMSCFAGLSLCTCFVGNNLYNILPDMISHLSKELDGDSFKNVLVRDACCSLFVVCCVCACVCVFCSFRSYLCSLIFYLFFAALLTRIHRERSTNRVAG